MGGDLELTRCASVESFLDVARDFLLEREAEHNLLLAIAASLRDQPEAFPEPPYLAVIRGDGGIACAALRTPPFNLLLSEAAPLEAVDAVARDLAGAEALGAAALPGVNGPTEPAARFASIWSDLTGSRAAIDIRERIFQLRKVTPPAAVGGSWRFAEERDASILRDWLVAFQREALPNEAGFADIDATVGRWIRRAGRSMYVWEVGRQVVSIVGVGGRTPHGSRIGPVYTPPDLRGRGYASALTAAASQDQLDTGSTFCFLFTDLANPTSNHIYQAIGYEPVRDFDMYRFEAPHRP